MPGRGLTGIDTNVLLRHVLQDDTVQSPVAHRFMGGLTEQKPGFVSLLTLAEFCWVLRMGNRYDRESIAKALGAIFVTRTIRIERQEVAERALLRYEAGGPGFADHLIALLGEEAGVVETVTFDRKASRLPGWRLLDA